MKDKYSRGADLQYAPLDVLPSIDDVADDEDAGDDCEGDQSRVTKVLHVNVGIGITKFEGGGGKEKIISEISMSKISNIFQSHLSKEFQY